MFIWSFGSFAFFLVPFYVAKIKIGNVYINLLFSEIAEFLASIVVLYVTRVMTLQNAATFFSIIILIGSILMTILIEVKSKSDVDGSTSDFTVFLSSSFIMLTNFGVVCVFDIAYLINPTLFPTIFLATCYGACNVFGRFITIFAPVAAELGQTVPLLMLIGFSAAVTFGTRMLVILKEKPVKSV